MDDFARLQKQRLFPPGAFPGLPDDPNSLTEDEVPLWEGLCYRIDQECRTLRPSPGRQICSLLEDDPLKLLRRAAGGGRDALDDDERGDLLEALNEVLANAKLFDPAAFRGLPVHPGAAELRDRATKGGAFPIEEKEVRQVNRALLEAAYPEQIIPARLKCQLGDQARKAWKDRARRDLEATRKQYGAPK
jgi:hypothetical protein